LTEMQGRRSQLALEKEMEKEMEKERERVEK
jgi:hypothetical protein